ncbi:MAG: hypothetical protein OEY93_10970, partial [Anaerolineae bacterium]|nr:hypothetical protein [Anaerolineae bacterium]
MNKINEIPELDQSGESPQENNAEAPKPTNPMMRYITPVITIVLIGMVALFLSNLIEDVMPASQADLQATAL